MACESEVKGLYNYRLRDNGCINVVVGGVNEVFLGKSICRGHSCTWCDLPMDIKVL